MPVTKERKSKLDPYKLRIQERFDGMVQATAYRPAYDRLKAKCPGCDLSYSTVQRFVKVYKAKA